MLAADSHVYEIETLIVRMRLQRPETETSLYFRTVSRIPPAALVAISVLVALTALYTLEGVLNLSPNPAEVTSLSPLAYAYLAVLVGSIGVVAADAWRTAAARAVVLAQEGEVPLNPSSMIPYVLSQRRYRWFFFGAAGAYGLFYSFLTSLIVYQPAVDFAQNPGVSIPSAPVVQLFGAPFYAPEITIFLTDHLALILIPLTLILLTLVSVLVGLNFALALFAFDSRVKGGEKSWLGGLGAAVGLFTGCPTCAGLVLASVLGGAGAVSSAALLQYYQPVFIAISLPVLLVTPFMVTRSLSRVFREGCIVTGTKGRDRG